MQQHHPAAAEIAAAVARRDPGRLAAALTDAVNAVRRRAAEERDRARPATPALDRLRRLTETPEELWRETGLLR